jgi:prolipoprotein diacylglyceryltransferase
MVLSLPLLLFGIVLIVIALRRPPRNAAHAV